MNASSQEVPFWQGMINYTLCWHLHWVIYGSLIEPKKESCSGEKGGGRGWMYNAFPGAPFWAKAWKRNEIEEGKYTLIRVACACVWGAAAYFISWKNGQLKNELKARVRKIESIYPFWHSISSNLLHVRSEWLNRALGLENGLQGSKGPSALKSSCLMLHGYMNPCSLVMV